MTVVLVVFIILFIIAVCFVWEGTPSLRSSCVYSEATFKLLFIWNMSLCSTKGSMASQLNFVVCMQQGDCVLLLLSDVWVQ